MQLRRSEIQALVEEDQRQVLQDVVPPIRRSDIEASEILCLEFLRVALIPFQRE
jgi:hypothetical protein